MRTYDHVIVIGVDGAGAFFRTADTPEFDRIFADGAVTYSALSARPTISAECWGSMLLGTSAKVHGLTNDIVSTVPYPTDSEFPSLFRRLREAYPAAELGAICNWSPIIDGILENGSASRTFSADDDAQVPVIAEYIREKKPDFLFVQFDSVDHIGHCDGYGSKTHLARIHDIDTFIGTIHAAVFEAGIADSTLFCVIADHGGTYNGEGFPAEHGGWTDEEKLVTFAACGRTVLPGKIGRMNIRDLSAIVLSALGVPGPEFLIGGWTSQVPEGLFSDQASKYREISEEEDASPRISKAPHATELL